MTLQIDPRHKPLRGVRAISQYLGGQHYETTRRQIRRGLLDVSYDGCIVFSTPARLTSSPLVTGAPPIERPALPTVKRRPAR